jgi:hypothetical protein
MLASGCDDVSGEKPLKVLFIGNSYTSVNDLPGVLAGMADAAGGLKIATDQETPGGCTLEKHIEDGSAAKKISAQKWDVVVLQEQSLMPVGNPQLMHQSASKLHEHIKAGGARTLFYLTWARQKQPEMQPKLSKAYLDIAKELDAGVAPVGIAWQHALADDSNLVLHADDGSHPSAAGTYLAACVFYATLLDKSPVGLPSEIKKGRQTLLKIDPALAKRLQEVAWKTVQEQKGQKP